MTRFEDLPDLLLAPLEGKGDEAWFHTPEGKWSPAQVVDHVAGALELSARGFQARAEKPPMARRPRTVRQRFFLVLVFGTGLFPRGRRAPDGTVPAERPDRAATEQRLRAAVAVFLGLEQRLARRAHDLYLKHPVFGDLNLGEWMTFHVRHAEHHAKQVRARIPPPA